jgi:hypothetical protein
VPKVAALTGTFPWPSHQTKPRQDHVRGPSFPPARWRRQWRMQRIAPIPRIVVSGRATSADLFGRRQLDVMAVSGENATQITGPLERRTHRGTPFGVRWPQ